MTVVGAAMCRIIPIVLPQLIKSIENSRNKLWSAARMPQSVVLMDGGILAAVPKKHRRGVVKDNI